MSAGRVAISAGSHGPSKAGMHRRMAGSPRTYSAAWDDRAQVVGFAAGADGAFGATIDRAALELLAGRSPLGAAECLREFRRRRSWIETLAAAVAAERGVTGSIALSCADVRFQLACDAGPLPDVFCV